MTPDGEINGAVLVLTDLTSEHERLLKLYNDSITDELTGVYNRTYYRSFLDKLVGTKTKFTLAYLDLDHLKIANDKYGHKTGDEYILHVTGLLKEAFFQQAAICRFGGDEFSVLSEILTKEQVQEKLSLVDVLLKRMELPYAPGISYAVDTVTADNFEDFRQQANLIDQKLYDMKKSKGEN
ncbi:MAG: GGDEF domain-containing protein [Erysipelotrichia bacterium]|nr:GGDEF domain-containing protein [Erysipelotrichia bacterium]